MTSLQVYDQSSDLPPGYQLLGPDRDIINAVMKQESRGNPNAVSAKGARGLMQTMPGTEIDPGFGVTRLDPTKPLDEERARVGRDYLGAMLNKYGDLDTALVAYNWGSSRTDRWIKAGGDRTRLPAETQNYVAQIRRNLTDAPQGSRSTAPPVPMRLSPPQDSSESDVPPGYELVQQNQPEPSSGYTDAPKGGVPTEGQAPVRARDLFLRSMIGQGAMAGFGDEAEAATRATAAKAQGDKRSWNDLYDSYLANARNMLSRFQQLHPGEAGLSEATGAIGTLAIPGPDLVSGASWLGRAANAGAKGATYGAISGFGTGEGVEGRLSQAATGAAIGSTAGGLASPALELAGKAAGVATRPIMAALNPEAEAARRVGTAITTDQSRGASALTNQQIASASPSQPLTNIERGGELTRALVRSASNTSPEARQTLEDVIQPRFSEQGDRLKAFLNDVVNGKGAQDAREALQRQAEAANRPAYAAAYADRKAQALWDQSLQQLTGAPAVQSAIRKAASKGANRAAAEGYPQTVSPFTSDGRGNLVPRKGVNPNLRFWDSVKQNLDDQYGSLNRAGKASAARDVLQLKNKLVSLLDESVPAYQRARAGAASFFGSHDALSAGESFALRPGADLAGAVKAWRSFSVPEKQLFKIGFVSKLIDTVSSVSDRADVVRRIWGNEKVRQQIRLAMGPQDSKELEAFMHVEAAMDLARKSLGNSTTARQLAEAGLAGGVGYGLTTGDWSPRDLSLAALLSGGARRAGMRINAKVVQAVAKKLASNDPAVYQRGLSAVAHNATLMKALRSAISLPIAEATQLYRQGASQ